MLPEIQKTISLIDEKIKELRAAKKALFDAFGNGFQHETDEKPIPSLEMMTKKLVEGAGTRKDEVVNLLKAKGPLTRSEIKNSINFPEGTLSYVLLDKKKFINKDGKWHLVEASKEEERISEN